MNMKLILTCCSLDLKKVLLQFIFFENMLNPVYIGKGIDEDKQEIARQWLHDNIDSTFLVLLIAF